MMSSNTTNAVVDTPAAAAAVDAAASGSSASSEAVEHKGSPQSQTASEAVEPKGSPHRTMSTTTAAAKRPTNTTTLQELGLDTTHRKIAIHNVEKFLRQKQTDKLLNGWKAEIAASEDDAVRSIKIEKTRKANKLTWIHVWVEDDRMVEPFLRWFNGKERKNKFGKVMMAKRHSDEGRTDKKRGLEDMGGGNNPKRAKQETDAGASPPKSATPDEVRDKLTPYWRMSYADQLQRKKVDMIKKCAIQTIKGVKARFRALEKEAKKNAQRSPPPKLYDWLTGKRGINVQDVLPSPQLLGYRNKAEFTFGWRNIASSEGETPTRIPSVGFLPFGWRNDVALPHSLQNIPSEMCGLADIFNEFLLECPLPPYEAGAHLGVWRSVTIRSSARTGQVMIIMVHAPPEGGAGATQDKGDHSFDRDVFEKEKDRLIKMLTQGPIQLPARDLPVLDMGRKSSDEDDVAIKMDSEGKDFRVTSIYFQEFAGLSHPGANDPVQHVYGSKYIEESLGQNLFQVSPGAFFQVTTQGAEVLYGEVANCVREVSTNPTETILLDVCCGTGTIGLHCMKEGVAGRVIGVDISEPAIDDANANAKRNGFGDEGISRFVASRAELVLADELRKGDIRHKAIVAVVDPAREGLHTDVIKALRNNEQIQRLVYVSCNPTGSFPKDASLLCQPPTKKFSGLPFKPTSAQPVDMFPLTNHCEMVVVFDRASVEDDKKIKKEEPTESETVVVEMKEDASADNAVKKEAPEQRKSENEDTEIDIKHEDV